MENYSNFAGSVHSTFPGVGEHGGTGIVSTVPPAQSISTLAPFLKWPSIKYITADLVGVIVARYYAIENGHPYQLIIGNHGGFDIVSADGSHKIELKFETTPIRTNRVAVEYFNVELNKPSGISATMADTWLHLVKTTSGYIGFEYDVGVLRRLVVEQGTIKSNGRNALCKIIPIEIFQHHAQRSIAFPSDLIEWRSR